MREDLTPFRGHHDAGRDDIHGVLSGDLSAIVDDAPLEVLDQPGDGPERAALARAVGADKGDDLPLVHVDGKALQGVNAAVVNVKILHLKHRQWPPLPGRPQ